jgi:hypothetical protein
MKIPKKYLTDNYEFNSQQILIDRTTHEPVVKNIRSAGTEKSIKISGQDFWTGINCHIRSKISKELKKFFYEAIKDFEPLQDSDYPIGIDLNIYDVLEGADIDNLTFVYRKCLHDALGGNVEFIKDANGKFCPDRTKYPPIIQDDSLFFVRRICSEFHPIKCHEDNMMIIKLYKL